MHISPYVTIRMQTCQKMKPSLQTSTHARAICLAMETLHPRVTPSTLDVWQEELMSIQLLQIPQSTISNTVSPRRHYHQKESTAIRNRNVKTHPRKRKVQLHL